MQGIFFDLGGTLFSYRNVPRVTAPLVLEAAQRFGVTADQTTVKNAYTRAAADTTAAYVDKAYYLHRHFFEDTLRRFAELLDAAAEESVKCPAAIFCLLRIAVLIGLFPCCPDALRSTFR